MSISSMSSLLSLSSLLNNPDWNHPWWRVDWGQKEALKKKLENFTLSRQDVKEIKILVAGQIGAGKSSFINSVESALRGKICSRAIANSAASGHSFTQKLKGFTIKSEKKTLPFVFKDVMGLESEIFDGAQTEDIINAVFGHVKDGYKFNEEQPLTFKDPDFNCDPTLSDQCFCLVYVMDASTVSLTDDKLFDKLKIICKRTTDKGIPQVIVLTKVDEACPLVKQDLRMIYKSRRIQEKMELCNAKVGVPMTDIFPVKNYHNEMDTDDDADFLILKAFDQIVSSANARLSSSPSKPELDEPFRKFDWGEKENLKRRLENFCISIPNVTQIKILVAGQIGAGKSSFINSVSSAFQGEIVCEALPDASGSAVTCSFTKQLKAYHIRSEDADLPFKICDIMGFEPEALYESELDDAINTLYGHVKEGYKFNKEKSITTDDEYYNESPSLRDQAFCLVYVIDASTFQMSVDKTILIKKLRTIRERISSTGIPQVVVMTKVDKVCPLVKEDLKKVYYSRKIKDMVELCSSNVGVPLNNIFPVKNYHDEIDTDDDADALILKAFYQIVRSANARLRQRASKS